MKPGRSEISDRVREQEQRRQERDRFVAALAALLAGIDQARMSIGLGMSGPLKDVAELWRDMRDAVPGLHGYPTEAEAAVVLHTFLWGER